MSKRASNLETQNLNSKYLSEIQAVVSKIIFHQSEVIELYEFLKNIKPGSLKDNFKYNYLFALDLDTTLQPEVLSIVYPNPNSISVDTTPYLRMYVKSKTPIISTGVTLTYATNCCVAFQGIVIIPGAHALPTYYQGGQGLALIESQQWDGSVFLTSLLISPAQTLLDNYQIDILRKPSCALALIEDAGGNYSNYWNWPPNSYYWPTTLECNSRTTQALVEVRDFDNLKQVYNNLAQANEEFQQLKIVSEGLESKFSVLFGILAEANLIKSQLDLLDIHISEEQTALAKASADLKIKQEIDAKVASERVAAELKAKQEALAKGAATKKSTITCVKGKLTKKVTAVKPKCPAGYKVKK